MKEFPLVSVIVLTYNSEEFVFETLESIKFQTYQNIELIITDDCSQDRTLEICEKWLSQNSNNFIRTDLVRSFENTGIPANCNRGVEAARGDWIKLIAGDDILMNHCLEANIDHIIDYKKKNSINIHCLFSKVQKFNTTLTKSNLMPSRSLSGSEITKQDITAAEQFRLMIKNGNYWPAPTSFINREKLYSVNCFDEKFRYMEDFPLWLKMTNSGIKLYYMDIDTVYYRKHNNSVIEQENKYNALINPFHIKQHKFMKDCMIPHYGVKRKYNYYYTYFIKSFFIKSHFLNKNKLINRILLRGLMLLSLKK